MRRAQDRARSATIKSRALGAFKLASEARDENVPAKRADFFQLGYSAQKIFYSPKKMLAARKKAGLLRLKCRRLSLPYVHAYVRANQYVFAVYCAQISM